MSDFNDKMGPVKRINPEPKKLSYDDMLVVYRPGDHNIISLVHPETKQSLYFKDNNWDTYKKEHPTAVLLTWAEVMPLIEKAQEDRFCDDFTEITEEQWWEVYEQLPPYRVKRTDKYFRFLNSEYMCGNITDHYFRIQDRYFGAYRRDTDNPDDHYNEIIAKFF